MSRYRFLGIEGITNGTKPIDNPQPPQPIQETESDQTEESDE